MTGSGQNLFERLRDILDASSRTTFHGDDVSVLRYDDAAGNAMILIERRVTKQKVWTQRRRVSAELLEAVDHDIRKVGERLDGTKSKAGPGFHRGIANYLTDNELVCFHPQTLAECQLIVSGLTK